MFGTIQFLALLPVCSAFAASAPSINGQFELKYFNARGAAETIRILLALADQPYEDTRYDITPGTMDAPEFTAAKEAGELKMNLNRAPVLVTPEGLSIGQSKAIERHLARKFGLMGKDDTEEAFIDCVAEHCRDVKDAMFRKGFSVFARDKTEEEKAALRKEWFDKDLPTMLEKVEDAVKITSKAKGCAVGNKLSYADVVIFCLLKDCAPNDAEDTKKAAANCEMLNSISESIASNGKVSKWLSDRPETMF